MEAGEPTPIRLPAFCPGRHINPGGLFCLFWATEEPLEITTADDADVWWSKLLVFLRRQETAGATRRWPGQEDARAHGELAARHQANAERLAAHLGPCFAELHRSGRFGVYRKPPHGRDRLRLTLDGRRFVTVSGYPPRVMTLRQPCRCYGGSHRRLTLRSCSDHARTLVRFVLSVEDREREEERFFEQVRAANLNCCGTLDDCPLASGTQPDRPESRDGG